MSQLKIRAFLHIKEFQKTRPNNVINIQYVYTGRGQDFLAELAEKNRQDLATRKLDKNSISNPRLKT